MKLHDREVDGGQWNQVHYVMTKASLSKKRGPSIIVKERRKEKREQHDLPSSNSRKRETGGVDEIEVEIYGMGGFVVPDLWRMGKKRLRCL